MAGLIARNEPVDSKRTIDIQVWQDTALVRAPDNTNFVALGILFVSSKTSPGDMVLGTGTIKNKRRALAIAADAIEAINAGADTALMTAHTYRTGDGPFTSDKVIGTVPIGVGSIYIIVVDANNVAFAATLPNAYTNTRENLTGPENGAVITAAPATQRGVAGWFTYTFTMPETDAALDELAVLIDGPGYSSDQNGGGYASAAMDSAGGFLDLVLDTDGATVGDALRASYRGETQLFTVDSDGNYMHKKPDGTDSHGGKITQSGGRVSKVIVDLG